MEKPRNLEDVTDKMKPVQLTEIVDAAQCRLVTLPDSADASNKVCQSLIIMITFGGGNLGGLGTEGNGASRVGSTRNLLTKLFINRYCVKYDYKSSYYFRE